MTPRSSKISSVRGWMPLPREPAKGVVRGLDQTKCNPATRKIHRERQPCWSGADNQNSHFVHCTNRLMVRCTDVKGKITTEPRNIAAVALAIAERRDSRRCPCAAWRRSST